MRMYRFGWLFEQLEINLSINLLWTTLFRNLLARARPRRPALTPPPTGQHSGFALELDCLQSWVGWADAPEPRNACAAGLACHTARCWPARRCTLRAAVLACAAMHALHG